MKAYIMTHLKSFSSWLGASGLIGMWAAYIEKKVSLETALLATFTAAVAIICKDHGK